MNVRIEELKNARWVLLFLMGVACDHAGGREANLGKDAEARAIEVGEEAAAEVPADEAVEPLQVGCVSPDGLTPLAMTWAVFEESGGLAESVDLTQLELSLTNNTDSALTVSFRVQGDQGTGSFTPFVVETLELGPKGTYTESVDVSNLEGGDTPNYGSRMLTASASVLDGDSGAPLLSATAPPLFYHFGTATEVLGTPGPHVGTVYDSRTASETFRGGDLLSLVPEDIDEGYAFGGTIPSRVIYGGGPIETKGRTTPADLAVAGLLPIDVSDDALAGETENE